MYGGSDFLPPNFGKSQQHQQQGNFAPAPQVHQPANPFQAADYAFEEYVIIFNYYFILLFLLLFIILLIYKLIARKWMPIYC